MKYSVECTVVYNGYAEIEAETAEQAVKLIDESLYGKNLDGFPDQVQAGKVSFSFGEATADSAYECPYDD